MTLSCDEVRDVAPELAAGSLTGRERSDALVHLAGCGQCQAEVAALVRVADGVLQAVPSAEPGPGFELRVLRAAGLPRVRRRPWTGLSWALALGGAVVAGAVVAVAALGLSGPGRRSAQGPIGAAAPLRAGDGRDVGWAYAAVGHPGWVLVTVSGLTDEPSYQVDMVLDSGRVVRAGILPLAGGSGLVAVDAPTSPDRLVDIRLVSATGQAECVGHFRRA